MNDMPRFTWLTLAPLLVVLGCAGGARGWYVATCCDDGKQAPALLVQGPSPPTDQLAANFAKEQWFACKAPLANDEERTAHVAPGYPMLLGLCAWCFHPADTLMRWLQVVLGSLTAGCYFFFARRAFHNTAVATLAGLLAAFHPFWIINTAELNDGVLACFFIGASLALGARAGQTGRALTGLAFGFALAGAAMTRATLLPFAIVALLWLLWESRRFPLGWFAGFLALIGFINGVAPWTIRNYSVFERPIPIANSTYLHLWMGNHPQATGSTLDESALRATLSDERRKTLLDTSDQAARYNHLADEFWREVREHPTETLARRISAGLVFLLGERWFTKHQLSMAVDKPGVEPPAWLGDHAEIILHGTFVGMLILALLGWRWSYPWRRYGRLAVIAVFFLPLPFVLSHAEHLSGPRLPLDGVLLCFAANALANLIPGLISTPKAQSNPDKRDVAKP